MTRPTLVAVPALVATWIISFFSLNLPAQSFSPNDVGALVNGFQDDFSSSVRNPDWVSVPAASDPFWVQANGVLRVTTMSPNPNHLLYKPATPYDNSTQEVLVRIRYKHLNADNNALIGPAVGCNPDDPGGHPGAGIDFMLSGQGPSAVLLNDYIEWGPVVPSFTPALNTWYWLRLRQDGADTVAGPNIRAKVWLADGTEEEPANWQQTWAQANRTGLAGIKGPSWDSTTEAEVDYVLIKAAGLPSILVTPSGLVQIPVTITNQPQSQAVMELSAATFEVGAKGYPPPTCQWSKNGNLIAGATNTTYTIAATLLSDDQALFKAVLANVVSNVTHSVTSSVATLTVTADTMPPVLLSAQSIGLSQVQVLFSERITLTTATNPAHYALSGPNGGVSILSAALDATQTNVVLDVSPMTENAAYELTINGLSDQSTAANVIAAGSQVVFKPLSYQPHDIGNPAQASSLSATNNGYAVTAGGRDIGGTADQCHFSYLPRSGDFDVRVRLESLGLSDAWAKAGLMARETTNANSRFASVLATPSICGTFFLSRASIGGEATPAGSFPVNYPYTWLRLERAGNLFSGYASLDGAQWEKLGAITLALSNTVYFGMAVASHRPDQTATAQFRDLGPVAAEPLSAAELPFEPLAACSRRTALVISEIMYHPAPRADGRNLEFVELFNAHAFDEDLSGHRLSGSIEFAFPAGTILRAGAFLTVAKSPADVQSVYGISGVFGPFANDLQANAGTVRLHNERGSVLLEVNYSSQAPWPRAADGAGHSLVLARPSYGESDPRAWDISDAVGGSPGKMDSFRASPLRRVLINEVLANAGAWPAQDFVELHNHSQQSNDISGCILTDNPANNRFVVPTGTVLLPHGFVFFTQSQLGFGLKADGETIYFKNPDASRVLDAVRFGAQAEGVSLGRWPDGATEFYPMAAPTAGIANAEPRVSEIVINELMYHPISNNDEDQFIELYNQGANAVDLSGWSFVAGVDFTFPPGTVIASKGLFVVAKNMTNLFAKYPNLNPANTVGNFGGALSHGGERVALAMPDAKVTTNNQGELITNKLEVVVDEVTYTASGRSSKWSDGWGSSLELIDPRANHRLASNWADSDETAKAPWTLIEYTGVLDLGNPTYAASGLQVLLLGAGECLVDTVEVIRNGNNLVANGTFESGTNGWQFEGNHETSALETTEGFNSARSLHLRADARGDSFANRLRTSLTSTIASGSTATLRAKVRWLCGRPEILLRLRGNWLEADGRLVVPPNLGTPGARNSRAVANGAPAIDEVVHSPVLPEANQPVVVKARVQDVDGLSGVRLKYRVDPSPTFSTVTMVDNGTGSDVTAGDGIFSASIPGQPANTLVAFYVEATDSFSPPATARFPGDAPARECLVRFGELQPFSGFGTYRLWLTQATFDRWVNRNKLSNHPLDCTLVSGAQRIIYNADVCYSGSVWKTAFNLIDTPIGSMCDYHLDFPPDDRLLGATTIKVAFPGNVGSGIEQTAQTESASYWIARQLGLPYIDRRYVNLFLNGVRRGSIMFDAQAPDRDMAKELFPDDAQGEMFEGSFWFEADGIGTGSNYEDSFATMTDFKTSGGAKKTARYRWNFQQRAVGGSDNGYTNWFGLVDALNSPAAGYTEAVESVADAEQWMRIFAFEHLVNNWEAFGWSHGVNMYFYRGGHTRWTLIPTDVDISFQDHFSDLFSVDDPVLRRMNSHPPFRRAYWRAFEDAVNGPLLSTRVNPLLDARYAALQASGVEATSPATIKSYIADARNSLIAQLATVAAKFAVNNPATFSTNGNLVTLSGTAPITIKTITINGVPWPVTWTSVNNWTLRLPINAGTNLLDVIGYDLRGQAVPGASNHLSVVYTGPSATPQDAVVINEWMAANTGASNIADPADSGRDDWFELYNPGTTTVGLGGYYLTDNLTNQFQCQIPPGYSIAPGGFLLVWADKDVGQNGSNRADLHVNFKLNQGGEAIALFSPDGRLIDAITFGPQTNNVSMGRYPDGGTTIEFLSTPTPRAPNSNVRPAPFVEATLTGNQLTINFTTTPGYSYRVDYKDSLDAPTWAELQPAQIAASTIMSVRDTIDGRRQRIYRLALIR